MRPILLVTLLALRLHAIAAPQGATAGTIEGKVLRLGTGEPIPSVQVSLTRPATTSLPNTPELQAALDTIAQIAGDTTLSAGVLDSLIQTRERALNLAPGTLTPPQVTTIVTGPTGGFSFPNLPPGRYTLRASREGFFGAPINGNSPTNVTKTITIDAGKPVPASDLLLLQGGVVSGRVRDPNGQPVSGIQVSPARIVYPNGRENLTNTSTSKATDDRGEYRLFWLPPGQYYIGVTPRAPGTIPGPQDNWARTFFPGVTDPLAATFVTVKDGGEMSGIDIDIRLGDSRLFKISGTAVNNLPILRPNPATNVIDRSVGTFVLAPREPGVLDPPTPPQIQNALPQAQRSNGEFEIRNVRPGNYDLYTLYLDGAAASPVRRYFTSRTPVEVRNADVTGLNIGVNPGATISGEVAMNGSGGIPAKLDSLRVSLRALDTTPQAFVSIIGAIQVDAAGKFTVSNVPEAKYAVTLTGLADGAYLEDVRQGGTSVYDNGFLVSSEQPNPIQIIVNPAGATVGGGVSDGDGKPAAGVLVVLVPPESRRQNAALFRTATTDLSGHFTMRSVPPGQYVAFAWENIPIGAFQNAKFLSQYQSNGKPVTVSGNAQMLMDLQAIPAELLK